MTPGIGDEMKGKDPLQRLMDRAEAGDRSLGTLRGVRPADGRMQPGIKIFQAPPRDYSTPPSKAPRGMGTKVEGDLGMYRQQEAVKVFGAQGGKSISNPLSYRKPMTAIDAKYGPGDKVC